MACLLYQYFAAVEAAALSVRDQRGEVVAAFGSPPNSAIGPDDGRPKVLLASPSGASGSGNVTVLVGGAAFRDFGARAGCNHMRGVISRPANPLSVLLPLLQVMCVVCFVGTRFAAMCNTWEQ